MAIVAVIDGRCIADDTASLIGNIDRALAEQINSAKQSIVHNEVNDFSDNVTIQMKEAVDDVLLSASLGDELRSVDRDGIARVLNTSYDTYCTDLWSLPPSTRERLRRCADIYSKLLSGRTFRVNIATGPHNGTRVPIAMNLRILYAKDRIDVESSSYEPLLLNRGMNFPVFPMEWRCVASSGRATLTSRTNVDQHPISLDLTRAPAFVDPSYGCSLLRSCGTAYCLANQERPARLVETHISDTSNCIEIKEDSRTTRFLFADGRLKEISIDQKAHSLLHKSLNKYIVTRSIDGHVSKPEIFSPEISLGYLEGGRHLSVTFAPHDSANIRKGDPLQLTIYAGISELYIARFTPEPDIGTIDPLAARRDATRAKIASLLAGLYDAWDQPRRDRQPDYLDEREIESLSDNQLNSEFIKYNVYAAELSNDNEGLAKYLDRYQRLQAACGTQSRFYRYSLEGFALLCFQKQGAERGIYLVSNCLGKCYSSMSTQELEQDICRLIDEGKLGIALVASDALLDSSGRRVDDRDRWVSLRDSTRRLINKGPAARDQDLPGGPYVDAQAGLNEALAQSLVVGE